MKDVFKKNSGSFVTQAAILAAAGLFVRLLGFICRVPMTRSLLGDAGNSIYASSYALYNLFFVISSAGMPAAVSKLIAERVSVGRHRDAHRVFKLSMLFGAGIGFVCMLVLFFGASAASDFVGNPRGLLSLQVLTPSILIVSIMSVYRGYIQGMGSTVPTAVSQIIEGVFNTVFSLLLAYMWMRFASADADILALGVAGATAGTTISTAIGLIVMVGFYLLLRPRILQGIQDAPVEKKPIAARDLMRDIVSTVVPIIAGTAILTISNLIDIAMVKNRLASVLVETGTEAVRMWSEYEVEAMNGILQGKVFTITTLPVSISTALATAVVPSIATAAVKKRHGEVKQKINMSMRIAMIISFPCAMGIGVLADPILRLLFGSVSDGGDVLQIGAVSIVFLALTQIITGTLQGIGKVKIPMYGVLMGVVVKIIVNFFLLTVPSVNIKGAVIGTIACYVVAGSFDWYMLVKYTGTKPDFMGIIIKPAVASLVMGMSVYIVYNVVQYIVPSNALATMLSIAAGVVVYFAVMLLAGGLKKEDILILPGGKRLAAAMTRRGLLA